MDLLGWGGGRASVLLVPVWAVVLLVGLVSFRRLVAERHRNILLSTRPADEVIAQGRRYIVYLRSFNDERQILERYRRSFPTEEEQIAAACERYGSLIAIGNPAEETPALGAARLSARDDTWQEKVGSLLDNATFVIVRLGNSPGVLWELQLVLRRLPPSRVALLSALTADAHAAAAAMLEEHFDIRLPRHTKNLSVITFEDDWSAAARFVRSWNLRGDPTATNLQVALQAALVPFYRRLGFEADLPPVRATRVANTVLVLFVLACLCWGFLAFPLFFTFSVPHDGLTMSAAFLALMGLSTVAGIAIGAVLVAQLAKTAEEIWFPEHFTNPWWARLK